MYPRYSDKTGVIKSNVVDDVFVCSAECGQSGGSNRKSIVRQSQVKQRDIKSKNHSQVE